jgi:hypothetical protein
MNNEGDGQSGDKIMGSKYNGSLAVLSPVASGRFTNIKIYCKCGCPNKAIIDMATLRSLLPPS